MIKSLYLDDIVVIPQGRKGSTGQEPDTLREASFHAAEGWEIREVLPGVFSLSAEWMTEPVTVGGYGYSYTSLPPKTEPEPAPLRKAKR